MCDRTVVLPTTMSISADFIDWGEEYSAKISLAELDEIKSAVSAFRTAVTEPLSEVLSGTLTGGGL